MEIVSSHGRQDVPFCPGQACAVCPSCSLIGRLHKTPLGLFALMTVILPPAWPVVGCSLPGRLLSNHSGQRARWDVGNTCHFLHNQAHPSCLRTPTGICPWEWPFSQPVTIGWRVCSASKHPFVHPTAGPGTAPILSDFLSTAGISAWQAALGQSGS